MIIKQKLYKIALVSIAMVLMLVSIAGASTFADVILKTDPTIQSVNFLKFPVIGYDDNYFGGDWDHSCGDKSHDKDKSCDKCPTCPAPALTADIHKEKDPKGQTIYNYNVTNTGNAPLTGKASYDNRDYPGSFAPGESVQFQTLQPILHKAK